jgi:transposase-like protein
MEQWLEFPKTVLEFEERFSSEQSCWAYLVKQRWPAGFRCPGCGHGKAWQLTRRRLLECRSCHRQVSVTAGTVFHGSRKPLRLWFKAMLLMTSQRPGISALSLKKQLGLPSYQTAWTWLHKLRRATLRPDREALSGEIEVDEGYVGGLEPGVHGRETKTKSLVVVAVEVKGQAAGRLRMAQVEDGSAASLHGFVVDNVAPGSTVRTDGWNGYKGLGNGGYRHRPRVLRDPKKASRLFPRVHRAISLLKRWLLGTHQGAVRPQHLPAYLHEFVFRYNRRSSRAATLPFERLCAIAVLTQPITYRRIVDEPQGLVAA